MKLTPLMALLLLLINMEKINPDNLTGGKERKDEAFYTRHSKATYGTYKEILKSDDPQGGVDKEKQVLPDVPPAGIELAKSEAEKFFNTLDPKEDALFFASSYEARALETAVIYKDIAKQRGFQVIKPEHVRGELAEEVGDGEIRLIDALSANVHNTLTTTVFNSDAHLSEINFDALDDEAREKWEKGRAIINADDKGSWGANYHAHAEAMQSVYPEMKNTKEIYDTQFKNLVRLAEFGLKKAKESGEEKNIKIMAFGHEQAVGYALEKYFHDHAINNCETIVISPTEKGLSITRRGETKEME